jgi:HEPN domain-containing protein
MVELEHAAALLRLASRDLNAVIAMQDAALVADEIVGFHAQQAAEKALKAWLTAAGLQYPLTHQLARLLALLESAGAAVESFWPLVRLTAFAVQARYEEDTVDADEPLDRVAIVAEVQALLRHVAAIVGQAGG